MRKWSLCNLCAAYFGWSIALAPIGSVAATSMSHLAFEKEKTFAEELARRIGSVRHCGINPNRVKLYYLESLADRDIAASDSQIGLIAAIFDLHLRRGAEEARFDCAASGPDEMNLQEFLDDLSRAGLSIFHKSALEILLYPSVLLRIGVDCGFDEKYLSNFLETLVLFARQYTYQASSDKMVALTREFAEVPEVARGRLCKSHLRQSYLDYIDLAQRLLLIRGRTYNPQR